MLSMIGRQFHESKYVPDSHPELMGKRVQMKFETNQSGSCEWFEGVISSYDGINQKYGIYFPCDKDTVFASLDDDDLDIID